MGGTQNPADPVVTHHAELVRERRTRVDLVGLLSTMHSEVETFHPAPDVAHEIERVIGATCLGGCAWCGARDRVFVQTNHGILSRCPQCGDEATLSRCPSQCETTAPKHGPPLNGAAQCRTS